MTSPRSCNSIVAVILLAMIVWVAGGVVIASNMGFKMHRGLAFARAGTVGSNLTSLPYLRPYPTAGALCGLTGLTSAGIFRATITVLNPVTGAFTSVTCGTAAANSLNLTPGLGVIIRQPLQCSDGTGNCAAVPFGGACPDGTGTCTAGPGMVTAAGSSIILAGGHDPGVAPAITRAGPGTSGSLLYSVPYHATAFTFQDLCAQIGMASTGLFRGTVQRLVASTGTTIQRSCGTPAAVAEALVVGEAVILRQPLLCSDGTGSCSGIVFGAVCSDGTGTCTAGTPVAPGVLPFTPLHF